MMGMSEKTVWTH